MRLLITALSIGFLAATIARAQTFNVLHDFGSGQDGKEPAAAVLYSKGRLYGTTQIGGATSNGTIYSLNLKGDKEKVVHSFMLSVDGSNPSSTLIEIAGVFYGTTSAGGPNSGDGTVFAFNPGTDAVTTLRTFTGGNDGGGPAADVIYQNGIIYGTTSSGGPQGQGTVFSLDIATGVLTTLHAFTGGSDGGSPASSLILNGGLLVGTSEAGGASGLGTVYTVDPITGAETVLHSFSGPDGERPAAAVTAIGNVLYGTAPYGGAYGGAKKYGVLFSLDMVTMQETTLHSFTKKDGEEPFAGVLNLSGSLFGTTRYLGQGGGVGTVYSFDLKKSKLSIVYHFSEGKDGGSPQGDLIKLGNTLYGTCGYYGSYDGVRYSPSDSPDA